MLFLSINNLAEIFIQKPLSLYYNLDKIDISTLLICLIRE